MKRHEHSVVLPALCLVVVLMGCASEPATQTLKDHRSQENAVSESTQATADRATSTPRVVPGTTVTPRPTQAEKVTASPTPSRTPVPASWVSLARGISETWIPVYSENTSVAQVIGYVYSVRLDPRQVELRVHYDQAAHLIEAWKEISGALIVVNGGFFSGNNTPVGRIIVDGTLYGFPLVYEEDSIGVPGMFSIIDGSPSLYSMGRVPFSPNGLRFDAAVECYPMLLLPGKQPGFPQETGRAARRTAIGIDEQGNIVIIFVNAPIFTLHKFAIWLAESDLALDTALNLDGGRSSGMIVGLGEGRLFPSVVPLPIVLAVYPR